MTCPNVLLQLCSVLCVCMQMDNALLAGGLGENILSMAHIIIYYLVYFASNWVSVLSRHKFVDGQFKFYLLRRLAFRRLRDGLGAVAAAGVLMMISVAGSLGEG